MLRKIIKGGKYKLIIYLFFGLIISSSITYAVTHIVASNQVGYQNSGLSATNVQDALDELYDVCNISQVCPKGQSCFNTVNLLPVFQNNAIRDDQASTYVSSSAGINFATASSDTNGKGLYLRAGTELTGHPIYYYRGQIYNNNVVFGNYCWKIVRTTETGGIKLVYNGIANDMQCLGASSPIIGTSLINPQTVDASNRIKYTYESGGNTINSSIKTFVDNWYEKHMTSYTSYLEDTVWCTDTTQDAVNRISKSGPTTACYQKNDSYTVSTANGNGKLKYPVGLLTSDELQIAGATAEQANVESNTYLRTGNTLVTMSVHSASDEYLYMLDTFGRFSDAFTYLTPQGVRPAISLKNGVTFASGNGTSRSPYYVNTNENQDVINVLPMFTNNAVRDDTSSTYVTSSTGINFAAISSDTNGNGLYLRAGTELTGRPIYYYRGAVTNNNVLFAGFCWKIVRTTETGGIKLVYSGVASNNQCPASLSPTIGTTIFNNDTVAASERLKYVVNSNGTNVNSNIKTVIDNWYASKMTSYTSYLEDTIWCNDTTGDANNRVNNGGPTTICSETNNRYTVSSSNGNGKLTYPVGLLTADEYILAGGKGGSYNSTCYLKTSGTSVTMSVSSVGDYYIYNFDNFGGFANGYATLANVGVRPAISLKNGVTFSSGNGTNSNPYVVATQ